MGCFNRGGRRVRPGCALERRSMLVGVFAACLSACAVSDGEAADAEEMSSCCELDAREGRDGEWRTTCRCSVPVGGAVDVLFVVDNTASMASAQATLARDIGALVQVLNHEDIGAHVRVGVTTSDNSNPSCPTSGDNDTTPEKGTLVASPCTQRAGDFSWPASSPVVEAYEESCAAACPDAIGQGLSIAPTETAQDDGALSRPWVEWVGAESNLRLDGAPYEDVIQGLQCMLPQGVSGCGFESQLESQYKALARSELSGGLEYGFLRDDAVLAVVQVTNEADCSYNARVGDLVFDPSATDSPFWNDGALASSACWNAGTRCTGTGDPFDSCVAQSYNYVGEAIDVDYDWNAADDLQPVLIPMSRYTEQLSDIGQAKEAVGGPGDVVVRMLAGVPEGYAAGAATLTYQEASDAAQQAAFGIDPGCVSTGEGEVRMGIPPVRLREFAEAFYESTGAEDSPFQSNLFSICADDYSPALEDVARGIVQSGSFGPTCVALCAEDTAPETPGVQANCKAWIHTPMPGGATPKTQVPLCETDPLPNALGLCMRVKAGDDRDPACLEDSYGNLEFEFERELNYRGVGSVEIACNLSPAPEIDCPRG